MIRCDKCKSKIYSRQKFTRVFNQSLCMECTDYYGHPYEEDDEEICDFCGKRIHKGDFCFEMDDKIICDECYAKESEEGEE